MSVAFPKRRWPLAILVLLLSIPSAALAQRVSAKDRAASEALVQRMATAEQRYRDALVLAGNGDARGMEEGNAALEDMEDVLEACTRQRGCPVPDLLAGWKRLLKDGVDSAQGGEEEDDYGPDELLEGDPALAAAIPEVARTLRLLGDDNRHAFDNMVQFNPAIQAGIRRWLTDMRPALMNSYENYQYMRHLMWPGFERQGLPEALLFGILAKESNGRVHATSRAEYLNERLQQLNNDVEMSLAGYNGGEGRALRVHRQGGGSGFWNASVYDQFPAETRDYVPMVIAAAWIFLHPRQYGVSFPRVDARPAQVRLSRPASLYELTICLGNSGQRGNRDGYLRALRNLNPRYGADSLIPAGSTLNMSTRMAGLYHRHCERGGRADLARALVNADVNAALVRDVPVGNVAVGDMVSLPGAAAEPPPATPKPKPAQARTYKVAKGDTLGRIAQRHGCEVKVLARANGLKAPGFSVRVGQQLRLEGCKG